MSYTPAQYSEAKAAGYSDTEIAQHLGGDKYQTAIKAGHSDADIIAHFTGVAPAAATPKADEQGNQPEGLSPLQAIEFERSGFNKFSTNPAGQRMLDNANEAAGGMATSELALGLGKGALKLGGKISDAVSEGSLFKKIENWVGQTLERKGAQAVNQAAGIRPVTVEKMVNEAHPNPGKVGIELGGKLADSGAVSSDAIKTFDNVQKEVKSSGEAVGKAKDAIAKFGGNGVDLTAVEAKTALGPLENTLNELSTSKLSMVKKQAKPFQEMLTGLMKDAEAQGGTLKLENIDKALKEIGPRTHKGPADVQEAMSEMYGTLANVRDNIVTKIAEQTKNPALAKDLKEANAKYSQWLRILPDLKKAAAKEGVGAVKEHGLFKNMWDLISSPVRNPVVQGKLNQIGRAVQEANKAPKGFAIGETNIANRLALDNVLSSLKRGGVIGAAKGKG